MAADDLSDLSSLSSLSPPPPSDSEREDANKKKKGILKFFSKAPKGTKAQPTKEESPPPRKREPSPPHEYVLADNPDIAFIVMFRNRFDEAFPRSSPSFGPQELEYDITETVPGSRAENFLCGVLGLLLNRKQDVKPGHYNRALEDAISSNKNQWPREWDGKNPLSGTSTFTSMTATERLVLLRALIWWAMSSSEAIRAIITKSYKQNRHEDDLNQPLSVQPWGSDSDKRRYFLIEGRDHTSFRVYRESNPAGFKRTWWSVADGIDSIQSLANRLENEDGGPKAKRLSQGIHQAIPRLLESEEKRRRREYRQRTKDRFKRPEPGFSLYEGRTRGKRVKYTFSDDEDDLVSDNSYRRSARNTRTSTPADPSGPLTTASGRQVRTSSRLNPDGGSPAGSFQGETSDANSRQGDTVGPTGRPRRGAARTNGYQVSGRGRISDVADPEDEYDEGSAASESNSGEAGDDEHVPEDSNEDEDEYNEEEMLDDDLDMPNGKSLVVKLAVSKLRSSPPQPAASDVIMEDAPAAATATESTPSKRPGTPERVTCTLGTPEQTRSSTVTTGTPLAFRGSPEKLQNGRRTADVSVDQ